MYAVLRYALRTIVDIIVITTVAATAAAVIVIVIVVHSFNTFIFYIYLYPYFIFSLPPTLSLSLCLCIVNSSARLLFTRASNCCCCVVCFFFILFFLVLPVFLCYALISGPTAKQQSNTHTLKKNRLQAHFVIDTHAHASIRIKSQIIMFNFLIAIRLNNTISTRNHFFFSMRQQRKRRQWQHFNEKQSHSNIFIFTQQLFAGLDMITLFCCLVWFVGFRLTEFIVFYYIR